jgi:hypothetical protein
MRFVTSRRWEMTTQGPKNKRQCSSVGPAQPKGKRLQIYTLRKRVFRENSDSECSACLSGLLTYIVPPYTPSPLTSRRRRRRQPVSPALPDPVRYARCPPPPPVARAAGTLPQHSLRRRHRQPVPPASPTPGYVRCRRRECRCLRRP